jgi:hypothetical protein
MIRRISRRELSGARRVLSIRNLNDPLRKSAGVESGALLLRFFRRNPNDPPNKSAGFEWRANDPPSKSAELSGAVILDS